MGKKKRSFIDRKTATTFSLVYEDRDEGQEGQGPSFARTLAQPPVRGAGGAGQPAAVDGSEPGRFAQGDYYYDDESVYEEGSEFGRWAQQHEDEEYELSEERRRELVSQGFPDDGYDYLRHLRDLGHGRLRVSHPPAANYVSVAGPACTPGRRQRRCFTKCWLKACSQPYSFVVRRCEYVCMRTISTSWRLHACAA